MTETCFPLLKFKKTEYTQEDLKIILKAINRRFIELDYNCEQVFTKDDRLKDKGYIHMNKLYQILSELNVAINTDDFGILIHRYGVSGCLIKVNNLIEDLNKLKPFVIAELQRLKDQCTRSYPTWQCTEQTKALYKNLREPIFDYCPTEADNKKYGDNYYWNIDDRLTRWVKYEPKEDFSTVMSRIQKHVNLYNLSEGIEDYFRGYDKLNSGAITIDNFLRGLDQMGVSENITVSTGLILRRDEIKSLLSYYADVERPDQIAWRRFVKNIQEGSASERSKVKSLKNRMFRQISPDEVKSLQLYMMILRYAVSQKRLNILPFFEQFDKMRIGYVTKSQFLRAMDQGNLPMDFQSVELVSKYYSDVKGFDYTRFLPDIGLNEEIRGYRKSFSNFSGKDTVSNRLEKEEKETREILPTEDRKDILKKALGKICHEADIKRLKLSYFLKPYDKHNDGILQRATFDRALRSSSEFYLTQKEIDTLMDEFSTNSSKKYVDILKFLRAVGELDEDTNTEAVNLYQTRYNVLCGSDELRTLDEIFKKIIRQIRGIHDWEIVKGDGVSTSETNNSHLVPHEGYCKILEKLKILELMSEHEKELLFKVFSVNVGFEQRFDLLKFLKQADLMYRFMKKRQ